VTAIPPPPPPPPSTEKPLRPFTQEWADALCAAINASESYRNVAARWGWHVAFVIERNAALGFAHDQGVVLALEHGHCKGAKLVEGKHARAPFVFRAPYMHWKRVVRGEVDPIIAVVKGEITFTGSMASLMQHSRAAKALVECTRAVPTSFPDE
jgi:putative sterol carrier protein